MNKFKVGDRIKLPRFNLTGTIIKCFQGVYTTRLDQVYTTRWDQNYGYINPCTDTVEFIEKEAILISPKKIKQYGIVKFMKGTIKC